MRALPSPVDDVVFYDTSELTDLTTQAQESSRARMMQPIQRSTDAPVQRLLNAIQPGSYVRPHMHPTAGGSETIIVMQGRLGVMIYEPDGGLRQHYLLEPGCVIDIEPGVWHGMVALAPDTIIAEFKKGPYDARRDKEFAPWSPEEGAEGAQAFIQDLELLYRSSE